MKEEKVKRGSSNWTAAVSTVVGITLVLVMLGFLCLVLLNAKRVADYFKENVQVQVFMKDEASEAEIIALKKSIDASNYSREAKYVTREDAAVVMEKELGEEFVDFLGYYPIPASIEIFLDAGYASPDSLLAIESSLLQNSMVREVVYQKMLVENMNRNVSQASLYLLVLSVLLLVIAIALINNTIRLAIYSKRFLIRSMQLVGATRSFIERPFVKQGILYGVYSGILAFTLIMTGVYLMRQNLPYLSSIQDLSLFAQLFGIVFVLAILISWVSTKLAVRRYIRLKREQFY
jgi:cell division transport system permease protein